MIIFETPLFALGFGILFATLITLFLTPVCYLVLEDVKRPCARFLKWLFNVRPRDDSSPAPSAS